MSAMTLAPAAKEALRVLLESHLLRVAELEEGLLEKTLAGGGGLISGVGTPVFRVIGGFAYAPQSGDRDGVPKSRGEFAQNRGVGYRLVRS